MNRLQFSIASALFLIAVASTWMTVRPVVEPIQYYSSCPSGAERVEVDVDSSFLLVESALARSLEFRDESIRHHVAFLKTHLKEQVEASGDNIAFTDLEPQVLWATETRADWPRTTVVQPVDHKDVELTSNYIRGLIGHTIHEDPTLKRFGTAPVSACGCAVIKRRGNGLSPAHVIPGSFTG